MTEGKIELDAHQTILFTGDSITDCCRREAGVSSLGNGYVSFVAAELLERYSQLNLNIINTGINGNTTRDILARWQPDCIDRKPDILSILIGINDLWRNYEPSKLADAVSAKKIRNKLQGNANQCKRGFGLPTCPDRTLHVLHRY